MKTMTKIKAGLALITVVIVVAAIGWLFHLNKDNHISLGSDRQIELTPTQIQSIKAIGEWEFLSVSCEELVDTVRKGIFSNDELVRIYYGTLRLGVNMHQVEPGWIKASGDSIHVRLPRVGLLDRDFIDEARTKSFYESGSWKPADREALYNRAYRKMLSHGLTQENLRTAQQNAEVQFQQMMRSLGYQHVEITFTTPASTRK